MNRPSVCALVLLGIFGPVCLGVWTVQSSQTNTTARFKEDKKAAYEDYRKLWDDSALGYVDAWVIAARDCKLSEYERGCLDGILDVAIREKASYSRIQPRVQQVIQDHFIKKLHAEGQSGLTTNDILRRMQEEPALAALMQLPDPADELDAIGKAYVAAQTPVALEALRTKIRTHRDGFVARLAEARPKPVP